MDNAQSKSLDTEQWLDRLSTQMTHLLTQIDLERAVELCADILSGVLNVQALGVWRLVRPPDSEPLLQLLRSRTDSAETEQLLQNIPSSVPCLANNALETGQIQIASPVASLSEEMVLDRQVARLLGLEHLAAIPLHSHGDTAGILAFATTSPLSAMPPWVLPILTTITHVLETRLDGKSPAQGWDQQLVLRIQAINEAFQALATGKDLPSALESITHIAKKLVDAEYGAVGVLTPDRQHLSHFVVTTRDCSAPPPKGEGVLGEVLSGHPLRLTDLTQHPASSGFPPGHPVMRSFLGVPIVVHGKPFGNLYVTEKHGGRPFTLEDELALSDLAAQAGLAIEYQEIFTTRREEELIRAIWESSPQGFFLVDSPDCSLVNSNPAAKAMAGALPASQEGKERIEFLKLRTPEGNPLATQDLPGCRALNGEVVHQQELILQNSQTGQDIPVWVSAAPLSGITGVIRSAVVIMEDISELKRLQRVRDEFSSIVVHDLRTPLAVVMGHLDLIRRRLSKQENNERLLSSVEAIGRSMRTLRAMIDDLGDFSRLEASRLTIYPQPVDVADLLRTLVARLTPLYPNIPMLLDVPMEGPIAIADPGRLEQILTNLITNAMRHAPESTVITLGATRKGDQIRIWVRDQGQGIPVHDQEIIFERFGRGGRTTREGLGLGLYIARGLARAHGGDIHVDSKPGQGSTFVVTLPAPESKG